MARKNKKDMDMKIEIKEFMYEHDLNLIELAMYLGYSSSYLSVVFNGHRKIPDRLNYKIEKFMKNYPNVEIPKKKARKNAPKTIYGTLCS